MTEADVAVSVFFEEDTPALASLVQELDELGVGYDEMPVEAIPADIRTMLETKAAGQLSFPAVLVNDDLVLSPTPASVMSAIMHARTGGFYQ